MISRTFANLPFQEAPSFRRRVVPVATKSSSRKTNLNRAFGSRKDSLRSFNRLSHLVSLISVARTTCSLEIRPTLALRKTSIRAPSLSPKNRHFRSSSVYSPVASGVDQTKYAGTPHRSEEHTSELKSLR